MTFAAITTLPKTTHNTSTLNTAETSSNYFVYSRFLHINRHMVLFSTHWQSIYSRSRMYRRHTAPAFHTALFLSWLFEARCFFVHFWLTYSVMIMVRAIIFKWHKSKMIFLVARNRTIHYYHPMHKNIAIFNKICGFLRNFENVGFTYQALMLQLHCTVAWNTNLFLHISLKQNWHLNNSDKNITLLRFSVHVNVHVYAIMSSK